jgi:hypothetical protein
MPATSWSATGSATHRSATVHDPDHSEPVRPAVDSSRVAPTGPSDIISTDATLRRAVTRCHNTAARHCRPAQGSGKQRS